MVGNFGRGIATGGFAGSLIAEGVTPKIELLPLKVEVRCVQTGRARRA